MERNGICTVCQQGVHEYAYGWAHVNLSHVPHPGIVVIRIAFSDLKDTDEVAAWNDTEARIVIGE